MTIELLGKMLCCNTIYFWYIYVSFTRLPKKKSYLNQVEKPEASTMYLEFVIFYKAKLLKNSS